MQICTDYLIINYFHRTVASTLNSLAAIACQDLASGLLGLRIPENKGAMVGIQFLIIIKLELATLLQHFILVNVAFTFLHPLTK